MPVTDLTWPRANVSPAMPAGGEKLGRGESTGARSERFPHRLPNPVVAHDPLTGVLSVTVVAVSVPVASLLPVAVMHDPGSDVREGAGARLGDRRRGRVRHGRITGGATEDQR